jgi:hypothetical protein
MTHRCRSGPGTGVICGLPKTKDARHEGAGEPLPRPDQPTALGPPGDPRLRQSPLIVVRTAVRARDGRTHAHAPTARPAGGPPHARASDRKPKAKRCENARRTPARSQPTCLRGKPFTTSAQRSPPQDEARRTTDGQCTAPTHGTLNRARSYRAPESAASVRCRLAPRPVSHRARSPTLPQQPFSDQRRMSRGPPECALRSDRRPAQLNARSTLVSTFV